MDNGYRTLAHERPRSDESQRRSYWIFMTRVTLGLGMLGFFAWHYNAGPILALLERERVGFFLATIGIYLAVQALIAFRWQIVANLSGLGGHFREYLAYYFIGLFTNLFVPGIVGGDTARAVYLGRRHQRTSDAIISVLVDRIVGFLALFWLATVAMLSIPGVPLPNSVARVTLVVGLSSLIVYMLSPVWVELLQHADGRLGDFVKPLVQYLRKPLRLIPAILISVILHASIASSQYILALGLGLNIPFAVFMVVVPIANMATSLPITVNGLGVRESAYVVLFGMAGVDHRDAVALGLLLFGATLIGGFVGVIPFLAVEPAKALPGTQEF